MCVLDCSCSCHGGDDADDSGNGCRCCSFWCSPPSSSLLLLSSICTAPLPVLVLLRVLLQSAGFLLLSITWTESRGCGSQKAPTRWQSAQQHETKVGGEEGREEGRKGGREGG